MTLSPDFHHGRLPIVYRMLLRLVRACLVIGGAAIFYVVVNAIFVPSGIWRLHFTPQQGSPYVTGFALKETERIFGSLPSGKEYQAMTVDPAYMTVHMPRPFHEATVRVSFANPDNQPEINLGFKDPKTGHYGIYGLVRYSDILESLTASWSIVRNGELALYQKRSLLWEKRKVEITYANRVAKLGKEEAPTDIVERTRNGLLEERDRKISEIPNKDTVKKFSSVEDFLANPPPPPRIATYQYPFEVQQILQGYAANDHTKEISIPFRGSHTIYTYISNEPLDLTMTVRDANRHEGEDDLNVTVWHAGKVVTKAKLLDDGNHNANGVVSAPRTLRVTASDLAEGVYRIDLTTNDDLFFLHLSTRQQKLVFADHLYLAGSDEYRTIVGESPELAHDLVYSGTTVAAETSHTSGVQSISVGQKRLTLQEPHEKIEATLTEKSLLHVQALVADVLLSGDGYFSFDTDSSFTPLAGKIRPLVYSLDLDTVDYILAQYPVPTVNDDGTLVAERTVTLDPYLQGSTIDVILQAPGLSESRRTLKIFAVDMIMKKKPVTFMDVAKKIQKKIQSLLHR